LTRSPPVPPPELIDAGPAWLRRARSTDAPALFASYANDPAATRYLTWGPRQSIAEVEAWLAPRISRWDSGEEYRWVIVDRPDGDAVGTVSMRTTNAGYDLGYALATLRSGEGIATSVVEKVLGWVDTEPTPMVVTASTDPDHTASIRVLEKCGFLLTRRDIGVARRPGISSDLRDSLIFERLNA
jgi:[ribosomal protein S5]-alanine N-acetyltransferase